MKDGVITMQGNVFNQSLEKQKTYGGRLGSFKPGASIIRLAYIAAIILQIMWIWNYFLLPRMMTDHTRYASLSLLINTIKISFSAVNPAVLVVSVIMAVVPIVMLYLTAHRFIVEGISAGAVKE